MYKVIVHEKCACFKKSEYEEEASFSYQQDAYNYTKTLMELMHDEFCQTHIFFAEKSSENEYIIKKTANPEKGNSCSTTNDSSSSSCGSCGC